MDSEECKYMQDRYVELKSTIMKTSVVLHEFDADIKVKYHLGCHLNGSVRSSLAQFHSCVLRDMNLKRAVKTYYIADAQMTQNRLFFKSHPILNFELIMNEIKALCELNHPNILRLFDVYCTKKYVHLVTEICKGGELYDILQNDRLHMEDAVGYLIQILEALKYMHSKNYCHRGLCLENILFADNDKKKLKIISFSGATSFEEAICAKYGSPMYMAPEVFSETYNEKCDIWSAGVIFFTMVTGHQPFQSTSFTELVKIITQISYLKSDHWKKLQKPAKSLIKKLLVVAKKRPNAEKVLENPLVKNYLKNSNKLAIKKLIRTVKSIKPESNFSVKVRLSNKIKISVYKMMRPLNVLSDVIALENLWNELGSEHSDVLMENDIVNNIERVLTKGDVSHRAQQVLKKFDLDKRGFVTRDEFIGLLCDISDRHTLTQAFNMLDFDANGLIGPEDFDTYFNEVGYEDLERLMEEALGSTHLDYENFNLLVTKFVIT